MNNMRNKTVIERVLAKFMFVNSILLMYSYLKHPPNMTLDAGFYINFYAFRAFYFFAAWVFSLVRRRENFFIPILYSLSERTYWSIVLVFSFLFKDLFLNRFIDFDYLKNAVEGPIILMFADGFVIITVVILVVLFQSQQWNVEPEEKRQMRIRELAKKAKITKKELETISPQLIEAAERVRKTPKVWALTIGIPTLLLTAVLEMYASQFVAFLESIGVQFPNKLIP